MVANLDKEDAKMRFDVVKRGLDVVESEGVKVLEFSDEEVAEFVGGYYNLQGSDTRFARRFLTRKINGETVYAWIKRSYSFECLYAMHEFSNYCDWLVPGEIVRHFGKKLLCIFRTLQGEPPGWCVGVPFHLVLQVSFVRRNKEYREKVINDYLDKHWDEAEVYFDDYLAVPKYMMKLFESVPAGLIEMHHVYTVYRGRKRREEGRKVRDYMKEGVEVVEGKKND